MSGISISSLLQSLQVKSTQNAAVTVPAQGIPSSGSSADNFGAAFILDINADFTITNSGTTGTISATGSSNGSKLNPNSLVEINVNVEITSGSSTTSGLPTIFGAGNSSNSQKNTLKMIEQLVANEKQNNNDSTVGKPLSITA